MSEKKAAKKEAKLTPEKKVEGAEEKPVAKEEKVVKRRRKVRRVAKKMEKAREELGKEGITEKIALTTKKKGVDELTKKLGEAKVVGLIDPRNLPDRLLQSMRNKLRGKAEFMFAKNTVIERALLSSKKSDKLISLLKTPSIIVTTSTMTPYSLFAFFKKNALKVGAKPGQIALFDIIVPPGETALPPGPALSELKDAGINAQIKGGKIVVAKESVVAKGGEKISLKVSKALQKLDILPFEVKLSMLAASEGEMVYMADVLNIDEEQLNSDIRSSLSQAFSLSINACFPTEQNINLLLQNAFQQSIALGINAKLYSDVSIEYLLREAAAQGGGLSLIEGKKEEKVENAEEKKEAAVEEKKEEKA
jgi:large subunit ribosomal protein L10